MIVQSYVGQWGDAALFTTASQYADKWRQVLSTNPDACDTMQLMTGRQIDILYEKTGSVLNPQKKVKLNFYLFFLKLVKIGNRLTLVGWR